MNEATFVVIGGGIAGITCVEYLNFYSPQEKIILITSSPLIKSVTNIIALSRTIHTFKVEETESDALEKKYNNLSIIYDSLDKIVSSDKFIITQNGIKVSYGYLCLCTGAVPKIIPSTGVNRVLGIRDTGSVKSYLNQIQNARRVLVVGNGGIASELVYETKGTDTIWVIKDRHISSTFIDPGAAEFFRSSDNFVKKSTEKSKIVKRIIFSEEDKQMCSSNTSAALGPDWLKHMLICGKNQTSSLKIIYECEVEDIVEKEDTEWPLYVKLSNGQTIECDLLISATGVTPRCNFKSDIPFDLGPDNGIAVDWKMNSSIKDIYAAGDVCYAKWDPASHWFQMRLWTQAHQMGAMAGKSMHAEFSKEEIMQDFCFELFTHTTKLFGYQVVLLGKFNGQGFGTNYEILLRTTPNLEYIKFVLVDNKLQGVILIGETGLEETCENLILNQIDLSPFGDDILNPDIDIEDYFD